VGVFELRETPGQDDVRRFPVFPADPVIMGDGIVDRLDPFEIGLIHDVLAARPSLGMLAQCIFERGNSGIEHRHHRQAERDAALLQPGPDIGISEGEEHQPWIGTDFAHDPVKMLLGTNHRPEVADNFRTFELRQGRFGQHLERFAGRIRQEMKVQARHSGSSWLPVDE
jgi:hypothetical protein